MSERACTSRATVVRGSFETATPLRQAQGLRLLRPNGNLTIRSLGGNLTTLFALRKSGYTVRSAEILLSVRPEED